MPKNNFVITDYWGIPFKSLQEMCEQHNTTVSDFIVKARKGYSIKECLSDKPYTDLNGNVFATKQELLDFYNISFSEFKYYLSYFYSEKLTLRYIMLLKTRPR